MKSILCAAALALAVSAGQTASAENVATPVGEAKPVGEKVAHSTGAVAAQPSLTAELEAKQADFVAKAPSEMAEAFERGVVEVKQSGVLDQARKVGDAAPAFELTDAKGEKVSLEALLKKGPVVLTWYRGGWCPYCNIQLAAYQRALPEMRKRGATLVALSPETPDNSLTTAQKNALEFHVLSDTHNKVARAYGVVYVLPAVVQEKFKGRLDIASHNGDDSMELPLAATYVIGQDGVIKYAFVHEDYRKRAEPADILAALDQ